MQGRLGRGGQGGLVDPPGVGLLKVSDCKSLRKPVVQRHQVVSDTLALLLFIGLDLPLGSRAAAPIGNKVL